MVSNLQQYRESHQPSSLPEYTLDEWLASLDWKQGEHFIIMGPTGTGKTTVVHPILDRREYVIVMAVKHFDDTLDRFKNGHEYGRERYNIIKRWPPTYPRHRVVYWTKPKNLDKLSEQAKSIHKTLNTLYKQGGWTIVVDDAGYVTGTLGLGSAVGVLLNQGRSSYITMVLVVTRPSSVIAKVPKEALTQPRHKVLFKFENEDELKACAAIANISLYDMRRFQAMLETNPQKGFSDFLYAGKGRLCIVRNRKEF